MCFSVTRSLSQCGPVMNLPLVQGVTLRQLDGAPTDLESLSAAIKDEGRRVSKPECIQSKIRCRHFIPRVIMPSAVTPLRGPVKIKALWTRGRENKRKSSEQHLITHLGSKLRRVPGDRLNSLRHAGSLYTLMAALRGN